MTRGIFGGVLSSLGNLLLRGRNRSLDKRLEDNAGNAHCQDIHPHSSDNNNRIYQKLPKCGPQNTGGPWND